MVIVKAKSPKFSGHIIQRYIKVIVQGYVYLKSYFNVLSSSPALEKWACLCGSPSFKLNVFLNESASCCTLISCNNSGIERCSAFRGKILC